jgi:hydroxypyruvate reductase
MKQIAQAIFGEALAALDIRAALDRHLARSGSVIYAGSISVDLRDYREIVAIVYGKASLAMAEALNGILSPDCSCDGILVTPVQPRRRLAGWRTFVGGHPVPNADSFAAGRAILERLKRCDEKTLILFLLSGGGSSLVESPLDASATLEEFQALNALLVGCGAPIEDINIVRRHLSATKAGRLAAAAPASMKLTYGISDVPLGMETALGSGPTLPDPSTLGDAERVISENGLREKLPPSVRKAFDAGSLPETLKEGDPVFERAHFSLILSSHDLTHAAHHACEAHGDSCICDTQTDNWPIEKAADHLLAILAEQKAACPGRRVAVVASGEVSSPVTGDGIGGRNSAFVLACVPKISGKKIAVLSAGTDGIDGNSPAAGAVADGSSLARALAAGLDPLHFALRSDAYHFFERLGDAIVTGPTGNNVRDLRVFLAEPD